MSAGDKLDDVGLKATMPRRRAALTQAGLRAAPHAMARRLRGEASGQMLGCALSRIE
jgi:hypothetical protein